MMLRNILIGVNAFLIVSTLIVLIAIVAKFGGPDDNGDGDGDERWWEGREAEGRGELIFAGVWMILVLIFLSVVGFRSLRTPTHFSVGQLGGSLAMFANLSLVVCLYFWNLEGREEDNNNNNNNQGRYLEQNYNYNNQEEEEGRGQRVLSIFGLVLSIVYAIMSGVTIWSSKSIAQDRGVEEFEAPQSSGHVDILADSFKTLSIFSVIGVAITFIVGLTSLWNEEAERMREEGMVYNFLLVTAWVLLIVVGLMVAGYRVFRRNPSIIQLEVGVFTGCLYFFGGVTILLAGLYGGFSLEALGEGRRRGAEGPIGSLFFAFLCFTFSVAYLSYAALVGKYHPSVLHANRDSIESEYNEMSEGAPTSGVEFSSGLWKKKADASLEKNDGAIAV